MLTIICTVECHTWKAPKSQNVQWDRLGSSSGPLISETGWLIFRGGGGILGENKLTEFVLDPYPILHFTTRASRCCESVLKIIFLNVVKIVIFGWGALPSWTPPPPAGFRSWFERFSCWGVAQPGKSHNNPLLWKCPQQPACGGKSDPSGHVPAAVTLPGVS